MKKYDLKEKTSVFYLGKGVIILALVLTSSLSFLLGFFVGKSTTPPVPGHASVVTPSAGLSEQNVADEARTPSSDQTHEIAPVQTPEVLPQPDKPEPQKVKEARETVEVKDVQQSREEKQDKEPAQRKENGRTLTVQAGKKSTDTPKHAKKLKYAVQIGAFKDPSEAESLKAKFSKKKYKAYIVVVKQKKHEKLYKVMVGEFKSRKEAEILSVKIKKSEGQRAFVALNAQEEAVR